MYNGKRLNWCLFRPDQLEKLLDTDAERGLTSKQAASRSGMGENAGKELSYLLYPFAVFARSLCEILTDISVLLLLLSSFVCSLVTGAGASAFGAVVIFVLVCALLRSIVRVYGKNNEQTGTERDVYTVIRDGRAKRVRGSAIVAGDLLHLSKGDIAPCDVRLVFTRAFSVIEKVDDKRVTAVEKDAEYYPASPTGKIPLRFNKNMLFRGSAVTGGEGVGIVLDEKMTFDRAGEVLGLSSGMRKVFEYEEKSESSGIYTRLTGKSAFGTGRGGIGNYSDKTTVRAGSERLMTVARICGLIVGTLVFVVALLSRTLVTDAFLLGSAVMAIAPSVMYESCIAAAFFAGFARLKSQGVYIRDFESAEKLALSKSIILCGSTGYRIESMHLIGMYFAGTQVDLRASGTRGARLFFELWLCAADLEYSTDKKSVSGDLEGLAVLEGARGHSELCEREIREHIESSEGQYDMNGTLLRTRVVFGSSGTMILERGSVSSVLPRCDRRVGEKGETYELTSSDREKIMKYARSVENIEGCRAVALCGTRILPVPKGASHTERERPIFMGIAVFGTKVSLDGTKYVDILRKYGIKPIILSGEVSDVVIDNSRRLGILRDGDNYMTARIYERMDEKIFREEFGTYTLFMSLDGNAKRAVINEKKRSEGVLAVAADKIGDAFDMSESDVLISCGTDAPKALRRISDIHSDMGGVDGIYRTVCICRNMIRGACLATGYLISAQCAAIVFSLLGIFASFINGGRLPMEIPQFICAVFIADLVIAMLTAFIKTPKSIIRDDPPLFYGYYEPQRILPKALFSGLLCGLVSVAAYLGGLLAAKSHNVGSLCAFTALYTSKALVSLVCIMPTSTRTAPAPTPVAACLAELLLGAVLTTLFSVAYAASGAGVVPIIVSAAAAAVPALFTYLFVRIDDRKSSEKKTGRKR